MKILLINPPQVYNKGESPFAVFPLGLGYIASVLQNDGVDVKVIDCIGEGLDIMTKSGNRYIHGLRYKQIRRSISDLRPDIVLLSCLFSVQSGIMLRLAKITKSIDKDIKVIAGGGHVSAMPEQVLSNKEIDFIVIGEAELPLVQLINNIGKKRSLARLKSIGYKHSNRMIIDRGLNLVNTLDALPFPAWDLFPFENYVRSKNKHTLLYSGFRTAEIMTSRGCPMGCSFCASHIVSGKRWRARSVKNIIEEINSLRNRYQIEEIHFLDDNLIMDRERFVELCNELKRIKIRWTMPNGMNVSQLDNELLDLMKDSGCYALFLAIESFNPEVLKNHVKKRIDHRQVKKIIRHAKKLKLYQVGFFLIGFFEESKNDIKRTINLASGLDLDEAHFSIVTPLPGSDYYDMHIKNISNFAHFSAKCANLSTKYLKKREIEKLRNWAYIRFELCKLFRRPLSYLDTIQVRRILRYIRNIIG